MENFLFKGFEAEDSLKAKAYRMMDRIRDQAPSDAVVSGVLDWDGERYHCTVEVSSRIWPAMASLAHRSAEIAIDRVELALTRRLTGWKEPASGPRSRSVWEDSSVIVA